MNPILKLLLLTAALATAPVHADPALDHAKEVLAKSILFDGHNDLPWTIRGYEAAPGDVAAYDIRERAPAQGTDRHSASARRWRRCRVLVGLHSAGSSGKFCADPARADRHRAADHRALPGHFHACEHGRRHPGRQGVGPHRRHARRGRRPRDRGFARGAAHVLRPRRALHDAHAQPAHELGRLRDGGSREISAASMRSANRSCTR